MKLAYHHRARHDEIVFSHHVQRDMLELPYDRVYGSAIFSFSADRVAIFQRDFPEAVIGGTWNKKFTRTVEDEIGDIGENYDYSIYPNFIASIGFAFRGCRMKCGFCVVPGKEGAPRAVNDIAGIWRGESYPRHIHLLDNDFFGLPAWRDRVAEIREGNFKVCLNQGINIRMVTAEVATALASLPYYDDSFTTRRLYTAWDNIGDEARFFKGVDMLADAGIPPTHLMAYMLVGYDRRETWERLFYRFNKMVARGIRPYPMVFDNDRAKLLPLGGYNAAIEGRTLGEFQRWVIRKAYNFIPFEHYDVNAKGRTDKRQIDLFAET